MNELELQWLDAIQETLGNPYLDAFMAGLTLMLRDEIFWITVAVVLVIIPKTRWMGVAVALAFIMESVITQLIIKEIVMRPRPFIVNPDYELITYRQSGYSFPSGHTGAAFALASAMFFAGRDGERPTWVRRLWIPFTVFAVIVGFSRLYIYVHYPSDVAAGMLFGIFFGWLGAWMAQKLRRIFAER